MRPGRIIGVAIGLTLLVLIGTTLWVGVRVGSATTAVPTREEKGKSGLFGLRGMIDKAVRDGHGAVGEIESIDGLRVKMITREGEARDILVMPETLVFWGNPQQTPPTKVGATGLTQFSEIQPGARIVVIGRPNADGQLEARIFHVLIFDSTQDREHIPSDRKGRGQP